MPLRNENRSHLAQNRSESLRIARGRFWLSPYQKTRIKAQAGQNRASWAFCALASLAGLLVLAGGSIRAGRLAAGGLEGSIPGLLVDPAGLLVPIAGGLAGFHWRACWRVQGLTDGGLAG